MMATAPPTRTRSQWGVEMEAMEEGGSSSSDVIDFDHNFPNKDSE